MHYAKIVDGEIRFAPNKIKVNDSTIYNPPAEMLVEQGYKPVVKSEAPDAPDGYHYDLSFEDDGDKIIFVWTLIENELSPEEILEMLGDIL